VPRFLSAMRRDYPGPPKLATRPQRRASTLPAKSHRPLASTRPAARDTLAAMPDATDDYLTGARAAKLALERHGAAAHSLTRFPGRSPTWIMGWQDAIADDAAWALEGGGSKRREAIGAAIALGNRAAAQRRAARSPGGRNRAARAEAEAGARLRAEREQYDRDGAQRRLRADIEGPERARVARLGDAETAAGELYESTGKARDRARFLKAEAAYEAGKERARRLRIWPYWDPNHTEWTPAHYAAAVKQEKQR